RKTVRGREAHADLWVDATVPKTRHTVGEPQRDMDGEARREKRPLAMRYHPPSGRRLPTGTVTPPAPRTEAKRHLSVLAPHHLNRADLSEVAESCQVLKGAGLQT